MKWRGNDNALQTSEHELMLVGNTTGGMVSKEYFAIQDPEGFANCSKTQFCTSQRDALAKISIKMGNLSFSAVIFSNF